MASYRVAVLIRAWQMSLEENGSSCRCASIGVTKDEREERMLAGKVEKDAWSRLAANE